MFRFSLPLIECMADELKGNTSGRLTSDLRFETVCTRSEFEALAEQWDSLAQKCESYATLFQSHEWVRQVLEADPSGEELYILTAWHGDQLVAVAPTSITRRIGVRTLGWIGGPRVIYGDVLAAPDVDVRFWLASVFQDMVLQNDVACGYFRNIRADAQCAAFFDAVAGNTTSTEAPYLDLAHHGDFAAWQKSLSRSTRKGRKRRLRDLEARGAVTFEFQSGDGINRERVSQLLAMKRAWADANGVVSRSIGDSRFEALVERIVFGANQPNSRMSTLLLDGSPIAIEIGFSAGDRYLSYLGAYDPDYRDFSPGSLQLERTIEACFEAGYKTFDLLPPADDYKRSWATDVVQTSTYSVPLTTLGLIQDSMLRVNLVGQLKSGVSAVPVSYRRALQQLIRRA